MSKGMLKFPLESIITIQNGKLVKIEHIEEIETKINQNSVEVFLNLMGLTPEEIINDIIESTENK